MGGCVGVCVWVGGLVGGGWMGVGVGVGGCIYKVFDNLMFF